MASEQLLSRGGGERICKGIGMDYLGQYEDTGGFSVWNLTGAGIARSIFAQRSRIVRQSYSDMFLNGPEHSMCAAHQPERSHARHQNDQ
jgi:hypothetical protein